MTFRFAENLIVSCPANISVNLGEANNVSVSVAHSLPATLNVIPMLGDLTTLERNNTGSEHIMTIMANDTRLMLGKSISVTWSVAYNSTGCSGVINEPSVERACQAIITSASCTTNVYTYSK